VSSNLLPREQHSRVDQREELAYLLLGLLVSLFKISFVFGHF
jgi:hypothetical protein